MTKYVYMKLVGLILVVVGFSYSLTSFTNFWAYLYGDITIANANIYIMSLGLIFPLFIFIFGVYFYFYTDKQPEYINPFILFSSVEMLLVGIFRLIIKTGLMQFLHLSFGFVSILFGVLLIYGCIKFKY